MQKDHIRLKAEEAVRQAGNILLSSGAGQYKITVKGMANFVTEVDYKVQKYLVGVLDEILPGSNIITEESEENRYDLEGPTWLLDPVDGTTNLMYGYGLSAVSLALFLGGKPALGMIYNPFTREMFVGAAGKGAWLNGNPIRVSGSRSMRDSLVAFGTTPYDRSATDETFTCLRKVYATCRDIRRSGSAALDLAYVAGGRLDGFFELCLQPWDFAAGLVILEEAGGKITRRDGSGIDVVRPGSVLATNGLIHGQLMELVK